MAQIQLNPNASWQDNNTACAVFQPHTQVNFILAIIGTIVFSYIIQVIYYKVMLYVALGKKTA